MTTREEAFRRWRDVRDSDEFIDQQPEAVKKAKELQDEIDRIERESLSSRARMQREIQEQVDKEEKA